MNADDEEGQEELGEDNPRPTPSQKLNSCTSRATHCTMKTKCIMELLIEFNVNCCNMYSANHKQVGTL